MTYEYVCTACAHEWEATQSIKDAALKECPQCHAQTAKRQVSGGTGFVLKGGGWYADLYSSSKPSAPADKSEASDSSGSSAKTEKKTESTSTDSTSTPKAAAPAAKPTSSAD
jgi:putative FmdB family regulatory protein